MKTSQAKRDASRSYYQRHKDRLKASARKYHFKHRDRVLASRRGYRTRNKTLIAARNKKRRHELQAWFRDLKSKLTCMDCPENHPACLEFHHRDPSTKLFDVGTGKNGLSHATVLAEMAKCDIVCANCHRKRHWNDDVPQ